MSGVSGSSGGIGTACTGGVVGSTCCGSVSGVSGDVTCYLRGGNGDSGRDNAGIEAGGGKGGVITKVVLAVGVSEDSLSRTTSYGRFDCAVLCSGSMGNNRTVDEAVAVSHEGNVVSGVGLGHACVFGEFGILALAVADEVFHGTVEDTVKSKAKNTVRNDYAVITSKPFIVGCAGGSKQTRHSARGIWFIVGNAALAAAGAGTVVIIGVMIACTAGTDIRCFSGVATSAREAADAGVTAVAVFVAVIRYRYQLPLIELWASSRAAISSEQRVASRA